MHQVNSRYWSLLEPHKYKSSKRLGLPKRNRREYRIVVKFVVIVVVVVVVVIVSAQCMASSLPSGNTRPFNHKHSYGDPIAFPKASLSTAMEVLWRF